MITAFLHPLRPVPAAFILAPALAVSLLYRPGVAGALVYIVALLVVLRYGYLVVEERAWGGSRDAVTDWSAFNLGFGAPLKQIVVLVVFAMAHGVTVAYAGAAAGWILLAALNLIAPATILIVALDGSLVNALTPSRISGVIAAAGFDYLAACGLLILLSLAGNIALDLILASAAPFLRLFIYSACSFYYVLAVFFIMAGVVERRREDLVA